MFTRIRAFIARRRIPRCWQCRALIDAKPGWGKIVCDNPECRELDDFETSLGA
jgi:hypothetical protein